MPAERTVPEAATDTHEEQMSSSDAHRFDPTILREYDIRGTIDETLSATDARALGRAFAKVVSRNGGKRVAVGYDGRIPSPELELALIDGLMKSGCEVLRIGRGPTPMHSRSEEHTSELQ